MHCVNFLYLHNFAALLNLLSAYLQWGWVGLGWDLLYEAWRDCSLLVIRGCDGNCPAEANVKWTDYLKTQQS